MRVPRCCSVRNQENVTDDDEKARYFRQAILDVRYSMSYKNIEADLTQVVYSRLVELPYNKHCNYLLFNNK